MFRTLLSLLLLFCIENELNGQCSSGGAVWLNGQNDGQMRDTGLLGGWVQVYARTVGTMSSGRPLYRVGSSSWKGLPYASLQVWRAYSSPGTNYTSFKLDTPLDSSIMHVRVDNIRGDFFNLETQAVRGYLNGVQVPASFTDPVNGATNSGDRIYGGSSTSSTVQSSMRVIFHGAVDSIVVQQVALSDWIIAELMIQCNILLPLELGSWRAGRIGRTALLSWQTIAEPSSLSRFDVERSGDDLRFKKIASADASGSGSRYQRTDSFPLAGINYYRLRIIYKDGLHEFSDIRTVDMRNNIVSAIRIFPNPATSYIHLTTADRSSRIWIYTAEGKLFRGPLAGGLFLSIDCSLWPRGNYLMKVESDGSPHVERILIR